AYPPALRRTDDAFRGRSGIEPSRVDPGAGARRRAEVHRSGQADDRHCGGFLEECVQVNPQVKSSPEEGFVSRVVQSANLLFTRAYHRTEVLSPPHLPRKGA